MGPNKNSSWFLLTFALPLDHSFFLISPMSVFAPRLLNVLLTGLHPVLRQNVPLKLSSSFYPTTLPCVPGTFGKKKRTSEMLWRRSGDLHPRLDTILCISLVLYFLCPLPWMRHSSLLFLSAHFGATILAVRPVTVTLSQFYAHFLSVTRFISSTLPLPFSASPDTLSTLLCNQTHCLMPFSNYFPRFFRSTGH